jgi:F-type H+-transporting ATPase subunit epsilon
MAKDIHLMVITPEHQVLDEQAHFVAFPAHDGEYGVLRDRSALMCELGIGELRYEQDGQTHHFFIDGGFAQVFDNQVTLLTAQALPTSEITPETIAAAVKDVEKHAGTDDDARTAYEQAQKRVSVLRNLAPGH